MANRVGHASWQSLLLNTTNSTAYPTAATNGVAVASGRMLEYSHFMVSANVNTSWVVTGYAVVNGATSEGYWVDLDTFAGNNGRGFAEPLTAATAYDRLGCQRTDNNGGAANAYLGTCEHARR